MAAEVFAVFDAARMGDALATARQLHAGHSSLYSGPRAALLAEVAPHLFAFPVASALSHWYFAEGWGHAWGIFCHSAVPGPEVGQHLRRLLTVGLENAKSFYLRFYDPRVLRRLLPTCDADQLATFFGPIDYFWTEDEDPEFGLYFWLDPASGELVTYRVGRPEIVQSFC